VLAGGEPGPVVPRRFPPGTYVIAADSGLHLAPALGLAVDLVVGDCDSVDAATLDAAAAAGTLVERHPAAKDETDLELALDAALRHDATRITVVEGAVGRVDHYLAHVLLIASPRFAAVEIEAFLDGTRIQVTHGRTVELTGSPGDLVTLLPVHGPARGVVTGGLTYPLDGEDLPAGSTRGVSNIMVGTAATVGLSSGTLLVVQP